MYAKMRVALGVCFSIDRTFSYSTNK